MSQDWQPALDPSALLRHDAVREADVLLLPERAVLLNHSAGAILRLCDGRHTPSEINRKLRAAYSGSQIEVSLARFLDRARALGWVR